MTKHAIVPLALVTALSGCLGIGSNGSGNNLVEAAAPTPTAEVETPAVKVDTPTIEAETPAPVVIEAKTISNIERLPDDRLRLTANGKTYELSAPGVSLARGSRVRTIDDKASDRVTSFETENFIVVGGGLGQRFDIFEQAGEQTGTFSGISGTLNAPPTGSATYAGHYSAVTNGAQRGDYALNMDYQFATNKVTGTSDDNRLTVDGTAASDGAITGTATYSGDTATLNGGFFGADADEIGAGFAGDNVAGYIYGKRQAPAD